MIIMASEPSSYGTSDQEIIINHVHQYLCTLDEGDRAVDRDSQFQSLEELVKEIKAYSNVDDIWYLAEYILKDEKKLVERDKSSFKVRLTPEGRKQCGQRLNV